MGDWELRKLSELLDWDRDEDRMCLWFKARELGGRRQRCSRQLKRDDWDRYTLLATVNAQIEREILPQDNVLTKLARLLICPRDHESDENGIELCGEWVSAWENRVDDDEDDEDYEDYEVDEVDEEYEVDEVDEEYEVDEDDEDDEGEEDEIIQISVENAYGHEAQESSTSSRIPEPVTPPIYETANFEDSGFFERWGATRDETPETPSRASRANSISRAEDSPATPPAPTNNPLETPPAATEPPLPVPPPLSGRRYSPYATLSSRARSNHLMHTLEANLSSTEIDRKTIYAFRESAASPFLKIGVTADFDRRMAELRACGFETSHVAFQFETSHAVRVERLLQLHLARERRREAGERLESRLGSRLGNHAEWFEVTDERATRVARGWGRWMESNPYHAWDDIEYRSLRQDWRARASEIVPSVVVEDQWMLWLDRHAPEPAPDTEVEQEAEVETPTLAAPTNVSGDSSDSVLPPQTSVPDLSSPQSAPASSEATASVPDISTPQSPPASPEATASAPTETSTRPSLSHRAAHHQLHTPNLVVQFVVRSLQLFLLLGVVGNMSHVQFCNIVLLAVLTLPLARGGGGAASSLGVAGWVAHIVSQHGDVEDEIGSEGGGGSG